MNVYFEIDELGTQPTKAHPSDAGWDLYASRDTAIPPDPAQVEMVHTNVKLALPADWFGLLMGRSSSMRKYGLMVVNSVIDTDYRGEILIQIVNFGRDWHEVKVGDRLAQLIILPVPKLEWIRVARVPNSVRGEQGFGSSGR